MASSGGDVTSAGSRRPVAGVAPAAAARASTAGGTSGPDRSRPRSAVERLARAAAVAGLERPGVGHGPPSAAAMPDRGRDRPRQALGSAPRRSSRRSRQASSMARSTSANAGRAVRLRGREVGAAEERAAVGREEHGHRPAALAGHGLDGLHVDGVDVGPLLAVDLDVDEQLVHHRGGVLVLERLVGHDVAPVAGRVADREQDGLVLGAGPGERLVAPRVPVDRVVGVLAQVGLVSSARRFMASRAYECVSAMELRLDGKTRAGHRRVAGHRPGHRRRLRRGGAHGDDLVAQGRRPRGRRPAEHEGRRWRGSRPTPATPSRPSACVAATVERFGAVDILVNNAATNPYMGPLIGIDVRRADKTMQVNQRAIVTWTQCRVAGVDAGAGRLGHQHVLGRRARRSSRRSATTTSPRRPSST